MKTFIGVLAAIVTLAFIGVLVLRIWDVEIVSLQTVVKSSITLVVLGITALLLIIIYGGFLRNNQKGYDRSRGNRAYPKV